jgi:adenine/guanine phosphoribosyltransferase-like PRPP-binding protein
MPSQNRVLIHDVLTATGGTAQSSMQVVEVGGEIVQQFYFLMELGFHNGREKIKDMMF